MLRLSKILVSTLALVPLFSSALIETNIEPPKDTLVRYPKSCNEKIIREVFKENAEDALNIAVCESSLNNLAVNFTDSKLNGHVSRGLFQMSEINGVIPLWWEPSVNTEKAYQLFQKNGWNAWYNCARKNNLL